MVDRFEDSGEGGVGPVTLAGGTVPEAPLANVPILPNTASAGAFGGEGTVGADGEVLVRSAPVAAVPWQPMQVAPPYAGGGYMRQLDLPGPVPVPLQAPGRRQEAVGAGDGVRPAPRPVLAVRPGTGLGGASRLFLHHVLALASRLEQRAYLPVAPRWSYLDVAEALRGRPQRLQEKV